MSRSRNGEHYSMAENRICKFELLTLCSQEASTLSWTQLHILRNQPFCGFFQNLSQIISTDHPVVSWCRYWERRMSSFLSNLSSAKDAAETNWFQSLQNMRCTCISTLPAQIFSNTRRTHTNLHHHWSSALMLRTFELDWKTLNISSNRYWQITVWKKH